MNPMISEVSAQDLCNWFTMDPEPPRLQQLPERLTEQLFRLRAQPQPSLRTAVSQPSSPGKRQLQYVPEEEHNYLRNFNQQQAQEYIQQQEQLCQRQQSEQDLSDQSDCCSEAVTELTNSTVTDSIYSLESESQEAGSAFTESEACPRVSCDVYGSYNFKHVYDPDLPITKHRTKILQMIEGNQVLVVQGSMGSGKTTQIPQYVLDHCVQLGAHCNIVVTQPRKLAARSVASWVSHSRAWELGKIVGYQVGLDKVASNDTRIIYMTTGILLRKLISEKSMHEFSHVFIDEIHERDQETDFLLLLVKKYLRSNSRAVKVILMSATIDCNAFTSYFAVPLMNRMVPAPTLFVTGQAHEVQVHYLEDIDLGKQTFLLDMADPGITCEGYAITEKLIRSFYDMEAFKRLETGIVEVGSVLVFLPGYAEITNMIEWLSTNMSRLKLLPLHSSVTPQEQKMVFEPVQHGLRKVILATNIAESSITVPDIKYVIDFCLTREMVCETGSNYQSLRLVWASKANCNQRKGRVGRTSNGHCYRIVTKHFWKTNIPDNSIPEMQRCPLESTVLRVKELDLGEPKAMLALVMDPPNLSNITRTVLLLKEIGALTIKMADGTVNKYDGELTMLGTVLVSLPLDLRLGKLLVLGHIFGCLHECLIIAASLSLQSAFLTPFSKKLESFRSKLAWSNGSHSDCIAAVNVYKDWKHCRQIGTFRSPAVEKAWGTKNMVMIRRMHEVDELMEELLKRLSRFNIRLDPVDDIKPLDACASFVLQIVLAGAFYPFYFGCITLDEACAAKEMDLHDPKTTIMLRGLPPNGHNYAQQINTALKACGRGKTIYFDGTRAYVAFQRDPEEHTACVLQAVYLALKMTQLRMSIRLQLLHMVETAEDCDTKTNPVTGLRTKRFCVDLQNQPQTKTQKLSEFWLMVSVTEVLDVGHFFAQKVDQGDVSEVRRLAERIRERSRQPLTRRPSPGDLCLAPFPEEESDELYRVRVTRLLASGSSVEVFFVDYGNTREIPLSSLKELRQDLKDFPYQAMECMLCKVRPSAMSQISAGGGWSDDARHWFRERTLDSCFYMQVFSIQHGILRVKLFGDRSSWRQASGNEASDQSALQHVDVGQMMVELAFAEPAEEACYSKQSHELLKANFHSTVSESHGYLEVPAPPIGNPADCEDNVSMLSMSASGLSHVLVGPMSSYQTSFSSFTNQGRMKSVRIDTESVNSVVVSDEPQDKHDRFLIAASVNVNQSGSTILLRGTTLMPAIHGLPAIVCMIFTPIMELRRDYRKTRYTGALCGLGWNPQTGESIFPDHDMEITFDTAIDMNDIVKVNSLRMAMAAMMTDEAEVARWSRLGVRRLQQHLRKRLLQLFFNKTARESVERCWYANSYCWNQIPPEDLLAYSDDTNEETNIRQPYQLHKSVVLI